MLPATILQHVRIAKAGEKNAFQPTHTDHALHGECPCPPAALEDPTLPTSAAGLIGPVGCGPLICTSECVWFHTRVGRMMRALFLKSTKIKSTFIFSFQKTVFTGARIHPDGV